MKVIINLGLVGTATDPGPRCEGQYLKYYNPEAFEGRGDVIWTPHARDAMKFEDAMEAFACYMQVPANKPTRPDGKPNKPLTAFTITIEEEPPA